MMRMGRQHFVILGIWLLLSAILILAGWTNIAQRAGWDPDDQLRLVQLRDFLNGQSWFDNRQYRMNNPEGAPMHWSRLVELPLAAIIVMLRPLFGQAGAEMVAVTAIPLALYGATIAMLSYIALRMGPMKSGVFAAVIAATSVPLLMQLRPMRIDHHGWQIAMAVLSLASLFYADARKAGIMLGVALAVWLHISLEGAPMSAAFFLYLGWRWLLTPDESRRLLWAIMCFAATSFALYFGSQAQGLRAPIYCDTISIPHLWAIGCAAIIMLPALAWAPPARMIRAAIMMTAAATAALLLAWSAPICLSGAFGGLDPLVREYWYANVKEGLPVWRQDVRTALFLLAGPTVGLMSCYFLAREATGRARDNVRTITFFVGYATLLSILVFRTISVASAFAIVPTAALAAIILGRYQKATTPLRRIGSVAMILFLILPGAILNGPINLGQAEATRQQARDDAKGLACESALSVADLSYLPVSNLLAPFDMGPMILAQTGHNVLASSHHRNAQAMHDHILIFRSQPQTARALMKKRGIDFLVLCPGEEELAFYAKKDPEGLWGNMSRGKVPDWLEPFPDTRKGIKVWRIR